MIAGRRGARLARRPAGDARGADLIVRAGADVVITYAAADVARWLAEDRTAQ
jgi:hypothetical protein